MIGVPYIALAAAKLVGGYQQADMIRRQGDIQASMNDMNAKYEELDAFKAKAQGYSEAARYQTNIDQTVGQQRTAYAGAHVSVDYGTAKDVQTDSKITGMLNVLELQRQGREKALGYQVQAINTRAGGEMTRLQAGMDAAGAESRGIFGAAETGLSGYARSVSSGVGATSKSGSVAPPTYTKPLAASYTDASKPGGYGSSQPSWFFGDNPRSFSQPSLGDSLFSR